MESSNKALRVLVNERGWCGVVVDETPHFFTIRKDLRDWIGMHDQRVQKKTGMILVDGECGVGDGAHVAFPIQESHIVWRFETGNAPRAC